LVASLPSIDFAFIDFSYIYRIC